MLTRIAYAKTHPIFDVLKTQIYVLRLVLKTRIENLLLYTIYKYILKCSMQNFQYKFWYGNSNKNGVMLKIGFDSPVFIGGQCNLMRL